MTRFLSCSKIHMEIKHRYRENILLYFVGIAKNKLYQKYAINSITNMAVYVEFSYIPSWHISFYISS
jgi:hypothetical protein